MCLEGEIRQVLNNLVRNALDAMSDGGRLLVRVSPGCEWKNYIPGVRITVADTGEGISEDMKGRLFELFQTTKELTGTGVGLWVSKGIIEKHGGTISVRSRQATPGKAGGTVFSIWLPIEGPEEPIQVF
jgi:signal transduction histidine kinase